MADNDAVLLPREPQPLSLIDKGQIVRRLWGLDTLYAYRVTKFNAFFEYLQLHIAEDSSGGGKAFYSHEDLLNSAEALKHHAHLTRVELRLALERNANGGRNNGTAILERIQDSYGTMQNPQEIASSRKETDSVLAVLVRVLYAINVNLSPGRILVGQSCLDWRESQSLEDFIQATFPVYDFTDESHTPIKPNKLRARYLEKHAGIRLEWTRHLPDHLKLDLGSRTKVLRIFELASLLEITYEVLKDEPWELSLGESLRRGCFQPCFLLETLQTILLLFPAQDRQWLDRKIYPTTRWYQRKRRHASKLDGRLSAPFKSYHRETTYNRPLTTRRELFARYPHWGVRLHILYAEAEDPTAASWFGRWAEQRASARHSFWLAFIAFMVAIFFGVLACVLAVIQIWMSYCQWKGQGESLICE